LVVAVAKAAAPVRRNTAINVPNFFIIVCFKIEYALIFTNNVPKNRSVNQLVEKQIDKNGIY